MEILVRGHDFEVWGDPRAAEWLPAEIVFSVDRHGTRIGAVLHVLARQSGMVVHRCNEEARRCEVLLRDRPTYSEEVRLTIVVKSVEDLEGDVEGTIAYALLANEKHWPTTDRRFDQGTGRYSTLASRIAEHMRRSGIRFIRRPPAPPHSSSDFGLRYPEKDEGPGHR